MMMQAYFPCPSAFVVSLLLTAANNKVYSLLKWFLFIWEKRNIKEESALDGEKQLLNIYVPDSTLTTSGTKREKKRTSEIHLNQKRICGCARAYRATNDIFQITSRQFGPNCDWSVIHFTFPFCLPIPPPPPFSPFANYILCDEILSFIEVLTDSFNSIRFDSIPSYDSMEAQPEWHSPSLHTFTSRLAHFLFTTSI